MTDTDRMVVWLRAAMDAAQADAEAAAKEVGPEWYYDNGYVVSRREDSMVATGSWDFLEAERGAHIARQSPAAVLRRITADRKILDDLLADTHFRNEEDNWYTCAALTDADGEPVCFDDTRAPGPCDCGRDTRVERRVRFLAEGYGWKEEQQ